MSTFDVLNWTLISVSVVLAGAAACLLVMGVYEGVLAPFWVEAQAKSLTRGPAGSGLARQLSPRSRDRNTSPCLLAQ